MQKQHSKRKGSKLTDTDAVQARQPVSFCEIVMVISWQLVIQIKYLTIGCAYDASILHKTIDLKCPHGGGFISDKCHVLNPVSLSIIKTIRSRRKHDFHRLCTYVFISIIHSHSHYLYTSNIVMTQV